MLSLLLIRAQLVLHFYFSTCAQQTSILLLYMLNLGLCSLFDL